MEKSIHKPGVVYLGSVPSGMLPRDVANQLSGFGEIGRVYLRPLNAVDDPLNRGTKFVEGWIEFLNKNEAKKCVMVLNEEPIRKGSRIWRGYVWNLRYLHQFTWEDLRGFHFIKDYIERKALETDIIAAKIATSEYIEKVASKRQSSRKRAARSQKKRKDSNVRLVYKDES